MQWLSVLARPGLRAPPFHYYQLHSGAEEGGAAAGHGGGGRATEDLHGVKAIPKIMDVDCVDHVGDHDPMTLGKSKKKEIIKESGREIRQSAIDGNSEFMESDDDANIEEDLVMLMENFLEAEKQATLVA
ncbi:hypothetical protein G4B88_023242 [Cannabis sativa]|uniref:Uncharacterized protein n=1 Tax=Cannabis sativa TaxID=3483 RepID=A0A7J6I020_CANSA|nr:hypothetical protein G4B88_023242 [Cannabis sativa]